MTTKKTRIEKHGDFISIGLDDGSYSAHVITATYSVRTTNNKTSTWLHLGGCGFPLKGWTTEEFLALVNGDLKQSKPRKTRAAKKVAAPREVKPTILDKVNEVLEVSGPLRMAGIVAKVGGNPRSVRNAVYNSAASGFLGRAYDPITGEPIYSALKSTKRKATKKKDESRKHPTVTDQILDLLQEEGPLPTREIVEKMNMNNGSIRALVSRMARTGQLKRGKDPSFGGVSVYSVPNTRKKA